MSLKDMPGELSPRPPILPRQMNRNQLCQHSDPYHLLMCAFHPREPRVRGGVDALAYIRVGVSGECAEQLGHCHANAGLQIKPGPLRVY